MDGRHFNKVFGIGLSRTGTTSLNEALNILGIRSIHYPMDQTTYEELKSGNFNLTLLETYDGLTDIVTVPYYKQLDQAYPGSKFILTTRDKASWLKSLRHLWYFGARYAPLDENFDKQAPLARLVGTQVWGTKQWDDEHFWNVYVRHNNDVIDYFDGREKDLLVMNICQGSGWDKLCPFLRREEPPDRFPARNQGSYCRI